MVLPSWGTSPQAGWGQGGWLPLGGSIQERAEGGPHGLCMTLGSPTLPCRPHPRGYKVRPAQYGRAPPGERSGWIARALQDGHAQGRYFLLIFTMKT